MLRELILALAGYPGDIFCLYGSDGLVLSALKDGEARFLVSSDLPLVHPSERHLLNRILLVALEYMKINAFVENDDYWQYIRRRQHARKTSGRPQDGSERENERANGEAAHDAPMDTSEVDMDTDDYEAHHDAYRTALKYALSDILDSYRELLADLEQHVLSDPYVTLTYVLQHLSLYAVIFPNITAFIEDIQLAHKTGCQILDFAYSKLAVTGVPEIRAVFERIFSKCLAAFNTQLGIWILHGRTPDVVSDFFIAKREASALSDEADDMDDSPSRAPRRDDFVLNVVQLPSFIKTSIANDILFIGATRRLLQRDPKTLSAQHSAGSTRISTQDERHFQDTLQRLKAHTPFQTSFFDECVLSLRSTVGRYLWQLVVVDQNLVDYLKLMRDIFLLGNGELYAKFLETSAHILNSTPVTSSEYDLNAGFKNAASACDVDDNAHFPLIHLKIPQQPSGHDAPVGSRQLVREALQVKLAVRWPLDLFFTSAVLEEYTALFRYLLSLLLALAKLKSVWLLLQSVSQSRDARIPQPLQNQCIKLRGQMFLLLEQLYIYFQQSVISVLFGELLSVTQDCRDFDILLSKHESFLAQAKAEAFLLNPSLLRSVTEIVYLSHSFCESLGALVSDAKGAPSAASVSAAVAKIDANFEKQSEFLFRMLSGARGQQLGSHISHLLLTMDFNYFYSDSVQSKQALAKSV